MRLMLLLFIAPILLAQGDSNWYRYPAISPNGEDIVFVHKGDLYKVSSAGGTAIPLTMFEGHETNPVWSPDGKHIAYAADIAGNNDVYLINSDGSGNKRLSFHSRGDLPTTFSVDGKEVFFTSTRVDASKSTLFPSGTLNEVYKVSVDGGREQQVLTVPAQLGSFDGSGKHFIFEIVKGYEDEWRKHHRSSIARDIHAYDFEKKSFTKLTTFSGEDRNPVFTPDGKSFVFLSERKGTQNVFVAPLDKGSEAKALTNFDIHPVRFLSQASDGTLCFGYHGNIYTLKPGGEAKKLSVDITHSRHTNRAEPVKVSRASGMVPSPNGKEVAFIHRGDVFVTSVESAVTKQITNTPQQERSITWHPEGRALAYASERNGRWNIYRTELTRDEEKYFFMSTILKETKLIEDDAETFQPSYSPDGNEIAFLENRTILRVLNIKSGEKRTILGPENNFSYRDGDQYYEWAPDGKWFMVEYNVPQYWKGEIGLISADGKGKVKNLTTNGFQDYSPRFMMGGKMAIWMSTRDGMQSVADTGGREADVYATFFTQEAFDRFKLTKEEYQLLKEAEKEEKEDDKKDDDSDDSKKKKKDKKSKKDKGKDDKKDKKDKKKEIKPLKMELDDIRDRKVRLTISSAGISDAVVTPKGDKLIYLARVGLKFDLWETNLRTRETKVFIKLGSQRGGSLAFDKKADNLFMQSGGKIFKIDMKKKKRKAIPFNITMDVDRDAERAYMFEHSWRQVKERFYDAKLHGTKWDLLKDEYAPKVAGVGTGTEFADLLSELLGELNASHTGARHFSRSANGDNTASLGFIYDASHTGPGLKVEEVLPKNPIIKAGSKIKAGVIIEKIDGVSLDASINHYSLLNRKGGQYLLLSLLDPSSNTRWEERVKALNAGETRSMHYRRWVQRNRDIVSKLSDGKVGYVHVASMSDRSYRAVYEEVMGEEIDAKALIVDTRFNGGGDLVEDLSNFLNGERYMDFYDREGRHVGSEPQRRWHRPAAVLMGEGNYSDAHCFPYAFSALGLGKTIGMPVPGTCTFVWWERQVDGETTFGIPNLGVFDQKGKALENQQLEPDILVENDLNDVVKGKDAQLEAAVAHLLETID